MKKSKLPKLDSIKKLAQFWDTHDLTAFENELEEVRKPVFKRGARTTAIQPYLLNLAGEYRVCSELNKRGIFATITYGNHKGVDVYAISDRRERALKIEVKTSQRGNFVTKISQKRLPDNPTAPDFWVLFQLAPEADARFSERFFILSHEEICGVQKARNAGYEAKYFAKHKEKWDSSKGVDNVTIADVAPFEDQWSKIVTRLRGPAAA